jgi:hypothetical protein
MPDLKTSSNNSDAALTAEMQEHARQNLQVSFKKLFLSQTLRQRTQPQQSCGA